MSDKETLQNMRQEINTYLESHIEDFADRYVKLSKKILKQNGVWWRINPLAVTNLTMQLIALDQEFRIGLVESMSKKEDFSVKD